MPISYNFKFFHVSSLIHSISVRLASKNRLARNIHILQVFFLQDLHDLEQNLASLALKMKLFFARYENSCKNLVRKFCKISFLQDFDHILQENYLTNFLARFLQDFLYLARKASFLV